MEEVKKLSGTYTARLHSLYINEIEVYEKQLDKNAKPQKNERSISVRCYRKKIGYRIFAKKIVCVFLKLSIPELKKSIRIDITQFLEKKYKGQKINKKLLTVIQTKISKEISVQHAKGVWKIIDYENLLMK